MPHDEMTDSDFSPDECRRLEELGFRPMIKGFSYFRGAEILVENMIFRSKITVSRSHRGCHGFQGVSVYRAADRELFCENTTHVDHKTFNELLAWLGPLVSRQTCQTPEAACAHEQAPAPEDQQLQAPQ